MTIFGIMTCSFLSSSTFRPTLEYKWCIMHSGSSITFFWTCQWCQKILFLKTTFHYKPTDSHSHFQYSSSHSKALQKSLPYSQATETLNTFAAIMKTSSRKAIMCDYFYNCEVYKEMMPWLILLLLRERMHWTVKTEWTPLRKTSSASSRTVQRLLPFININHYC